MKQTRSSMHHWVSAWLLIGVIMVFVQIILGGITRLTGSGLSITRWEIVTGAIPPLNAAQWNEAFQLYQETPQYRLINEGFSLAQFKFIYFWEYIHRLWARLMGIVFLVPFIFFLFKKALPPLLLRRLAMVILLAGSAAFFGWIMVKSGLVERPWVNAYKLTIHLGLGIALFTYLFFTWLHHRGFDKAIGAELRFRNPIRVLIIVAIIQIAFGGFVAGMKASLNYPTWPMMHGEWIPSIVLDSSHWNADNFLLYDQSGFMPALVQFIHRNLGYLLAILSFVFAARWFGYMPQWRWISSLLVGIVVVQVLLGIMTLLGSLGSIPVMFGALHQGVGILFFTFLIYIRSVLSQRNI